MPIITHPETGARYDATPEQVVGFARSGWVLDDDQSPIAPAVEPDHDAGTAALEALTAALSTGTSSDLSLNDDADLSDPADPAATATDIPKE